MLFPHQIDRKSLATESGELHEFLLNPQQPFLSLAVSDDGFCFLLDSKSMMVIQYLNFCDFRTKTGNLFLKCFNVVHRILG